MDTHRVLFTLGLLMAFALTLPSTSSAGTWKITVQKERKLCQIDGRPQDFLINKKDVIEQCPKGYHINLVEPGAYTFFPLFAWLYCDFSKQIIITQPRLVEHPARAPGGLAEYNAVVCVMR